MAAYAAGHALALRPHTKTHKSLALARRQMAAGAAGLTVAKVGEAEVMAATAHDLLLTCPVWDPWRAERVALLARRCAVRATADSPTAVDALAEAARRAGATLGLLVDLDVGYRRTGVATPEAALALARHIDRTDGVRLDGLMFFPGHIHQTPNRQTAPLAAVGELLARTQRLWTAGGLAMPIVSGGSTPTAFQSHQVPGQTEIRPGTYVYGDGTVVAGGYGREEDCAARVLATVVSNAVAGSVVVDAGSKCLSDARLGAADAAGGFGTVVGWPKARVVRLNEEHGQIDVTACPHPPRLGQRLWIIPNHACTCVNLHETAWGTEDGRTAEPLSIEARGKVW